MKLILSIAIGAVFGALSRHYLALFISSLVVLSIPTGIIAVNMIGSTLMGMCVEWFALSGNISTTVQAMITTGFLGSFTTFSAFALESVMLLKRGQLLLALLYIGSSVIFSVLGLYTGMSLVKFFR